jgi:hypothetical protein
MNKRERAIKMLQEYIERHEARLDAIREFTKQDMKLLIRSYSGEYYKLDNELAKFKAHLIDLQEAKTEEEAIDYIKEMKERYQQVLLSGKLMESSSSPMHCLTSLWENESKQRILRLFDYTLL